VKPLRILLYEHVSSGGYAGELLPISLLSEGYAMLRGLTEEFKTAGHEVTVLLDARIAAFNPPLKADRIVQIDTSGEADAAMDQAAESADAAYVIAPEPSHVLRSIVECIESTGTLSLNCQSAGIEQAAEKANLEERVNQLGLRFPKTETFKVIDPPQEVAKEIDCKFGFPVVVKPANGAGCSGLSVAESGKDLAVAFDKIRQETADGKVVVQEFISGVSASVSLISTGTKTLPVSLNLQEVTLAGPSEVSSYRGGVVPIEHPLKDVAFSSAKCLVESFVGLRGYIGVDFVLSGETAFVMEINTRLTTSYVGLRKVAGFNVAEAVLKAVINEELPKKPSQIGVSCFSKVAVNTPPVSSLKQICEMGWVEAPPFPLSQTGVSYAMLQSKGESIQEASAGLSEAKKRLQRICAGAER